MLLFFIKMKATKINYLSLALVLFLACSSTNNGGEVPPDLGAPNNGDTTFTLSGFNKDYDFKESNSKVRDRNFYWTTLVEQSFSISNLLQNDKELSGFLTTALQKLNVVANKDNITAQEYASTLKFTDTEINAISVAVKNVAVNNASSFIDFSNTHIGPSGAFIIYRDVTDVSRLQQLIVEEMLRGINQIIDTYGAGIDPLYPTIDAVSFNINSSEYKSLLKTLVSDLETNKGDYELFYEPFLNFALKLLEINSRDEAGRYFPLQNGLNKETHKYLQTITWDDYQYSMIVVLGDSPNSPEDAANISEGGKTRADHGVALYNQGKAPIIAFTGGHLWPVHTEYSEAIEMKKYIIETYDIPENRILVEPHSRHTTTNIRNIGRQIFRYGAPEDKKAIVSTSKTHSEYVASNGYLTRCQNEMGHIPLKLHERLSDFDLEFTSLIDVLHLDSSDPLDP